jgi:hypothetical protein
MPGLGVGWRMLDCSFERTSGKGLGMKRVILVMVWDSSCVVAIIAEDSFLVVFSCYGLNCSAGWRFVWNRDVFYQHILRSLFTQHRLISNNPDHLGYAFVLRLETLMISYFYPRLFCDRQLPAISVPYNNTRSSVTIAGKQNDSVKEANSLTIIMSARCNIRGKGEDSKTRCFSRKRRRDGIMELR